MNLAQESPAQETPVPGDSPAQVWISDWVAFASDQLPVIFLVAVLVAGVALVFKAQGGVGKIITFGIGVVLLFLFVTNVEAVSEFFREELPLSP